MPQSDEASQSCNENRDGWTRHPELYLTDGSLVILVESTLFRVYSGLLAIHSEAFRGMVDAGSSKVSEESSYDGCPLVMLSDTAEDVAHFLRATMGFA